MFAEQSQLIAILLLIVILVMVVYYYHDRRRRHDKKSNFVSVMNTPPYTELNKRIEAAQGKKLLDPKVIEAYNRIQAAEHDLFDRAENDKGVDEQMREMDFSSYLTDMIANPRVTENHANWVKEMKPFSGSLVKSVGNFEPGNYVHYSGLRRPQAVAVYNPTQVTELGPEDFIENKKFNFMS